MRRYPEVQLATLADAVPEGEDWLHEIKFDGYRLLGVCRGRRMPSADPEWQGLDGKISLTHACTRKR